MKHRPYSILLEELRLSLADLRMAVTHCELPMLEYVVKKQNDVIDAAERAMKLCWAIMARARAIRAELTRSAT